MKTRIIALLLALVMAAGFAACTADEGTTAPSAQPTANVTYEPVADIDPASWETNTNVGSIYITTADGGEQWEYTEVTFSAVWDGGEVPEQTAQIKYRGNSSLNAAKKSWNVKFEEKTSLLDMDKGKKFSLLGTPFDKSLLRVNVAFDYAAAIGLPYASQTRLAKLYLDGDYRGIYVVIEPVEEGSTRVDIDLEAGDFIVERNKERVEDGVFYVEAEEGLRFEFSEPEEPTDDQIAATAAILNNALTAVKTLDHTEYEKYIDIESFVNFYIFEEMVKDIDFGEFSTRYFAKDGMLYAGPPWDLDLSQGNVADNVRAEAASPTDFEKFSTYHNINGFGDGSGDSARGLWARKDFYKWLCEDEYFMGLVRARWAELYPTTENLVRENSLGASLIDRYLADCGDALKSNFVPEGAGWSTSIKYGDYEDRTSYRTYEDAVGSYRAWLERRIDWMNTQLG